jgi:hypothetical protein
MLPFKRKVAFPMIEFSDLLPRFFSVAPDADVSELSFMLVLL